VKSVRMNKAMAADFVRRVIDAVPTVDYEQKIRDEAAKLAVAILPKEIQAIAKNPKLSQFINRRSISLDLDDVWLTVAVLCPSDDKGEEDLKRRIELVVAPIAMKLEEQREQIKDLRAKLRPIVESCSTVKALREALPEFEEFMPGGSIGQTVNLPMVTNLVSDFMKAGLKLKGAAK